MKLVAGHVEGCWLMKGKKIKHGHDWGRGREGSTERLTSNCFDGPCTPWLCFVADSKPSWVCPYNNANIHLIQWPCEETTSPTSRNHRYVAGLVNNTILKTIRRDVSSSGKSACRLLTQQRLLSQLSGIINFLHPKSFLEIFWRHDSNLQMFVRIYIFSLALYFLKWTQTQKTLYIQCYLIRVVVAWSAAFRFHIEIISSYIRSK